MQATIARIEIQMVLVRLPEVGLLEDERHAQRTLPEVNSALLRRSDDGDVVNALHLQLLHGALLMVGGFPSAGRIADVAVFARRFNVVTQVIVLMPQPATPQRGAGP